MLQVTSSHLGVSNTMHVLVAASALLGSSPGLWRARKGPGDEANKALAIINNV